MKPDSFKFVKTANTDFSIGGYIYDSNEHFNVRIDERTYSMKIEYNNTSNSITYFPDKPDVKLVSYDSPDTNNKRQRIVFGLVCMKLLLSGEMFVEEL